MIRKSAFVVCTVVGLLIVGSLELREYVLGRNLDHWNTEARQRIETLTDVLLLKHDELDGLIVVTIHYPSFVLVGEYAEIGLKVEAMPTNKSVGNPEVIVLKGDLTDETSLISPIPSEALDRYFIQNLSVRLLAGYTEVDPPGPVRFENERGIVWNLRSVASVEFHFLFNLSKDASDGESFGTLLGVSNPRHIPLLRPPVEYERMSGTELRTRRIGFIAAFILFVVGAVGLLRVYFGGQSLI